MKRKRAVPLLVSLSVFLLLTACTGKSATTFGDQKPDMDQDQQQDSIQNGDAMQVQQEALVYVQGQEQEQEEEHENTLANEQANTQVDTQDQIPDNAYGMRKDTGETMAVTAPRLIAHAGGDIHGIRMTNSRQALDRSYDEGFRFIEVDICLTSDGVPVLLHDWGNANWFAGIKYSTEQPEYEDFKKRTGILGLEFMDLDMLARWLASHDDAYIITDIKQDNIEILGHIRENYPEASKRIIPQIYSPDEYEPVRELGYENIILTLYRMETVGDDVFEFCSENPLFGLTMAKSRAETGLLEKYSELGIPVYVHTINDYNEYIKLRDSGAYGVYTDFFEPSNWVE